MYIAFQSLRRHSTIKIQWILHTVFFLDQAWGQVGWIDSRPSFLILWRFHKTSRCSPGPKSRKKEAKMQPPLTELACSEKVLLYGIKNIIILAAHNGNPEQARERHLVHSVSNRRRIECGCIARLQVFIYFYSILVRHSSFRKYWNCGFIELLTFASACNIF